MRPTTTEKMAQQNKKTSAEIVQVAINEVLTKHARGGKGSIMQVKYGLVLIEEIARLRKELEKGK